MRPTKVISGGQTGADQAGLHAATFRGIPTGGTATKHFRTERGFEPELGTAFGLVEHWSPDYPPRTRKNVKDSDGSAIFGRPSRGTDLTLKLCDQHKKPYILNPTAAELKQWVFDNGISVLNVAGNRESVNPGIFARVSEVLLEAFDE